jgi:hypothetical protein
MTFIGADWLPFTEEDPSRAESAKSKMNAPSTAAKAPQVAAIINVRRRLCSKSLSALA